MKTILITLITWAREKGFTDTQILEFLIESLD